MATSAQPASMDWTPWIACVFAFGLLITAARLAWGIAMVHRLARRGRELRDPRLDATIAELCQTLELTRPVTVCESDELATPGDHRLAATNRAAARRLARLE